MFITMNRIPVNPAYAQAFEQRFHERARAVDQMPGFIRNLVLRPGEPGQPYVVLSMWESKEAFEAWTKSEAFTQGHARSGTLPREAFAGKNVLEQYEVVLDSSRE